jgi:signal transduction histidine kinase
LKFFYIFFIIIITFSCSKGKKNEDTEIAKNSASKHFEVYNLYKEKNKLDNELNLIRSFDIIKSQKNDFKTRSLLSNIVVEFYKNSDSKNLDESTKLLRSLSLISHDSINLGISYRYRANFFYVSQVLDSSYYYNIKAEKIYTKLKDNKNLGNILMNKGIVQYSVGDYLGAEISLKKANTIFIETDNFNKIYGSFDQLGLVAIELKEYEKGLFYFKKALKAIDNLQDDEAKIYNNTVCLNNIGYLYLKSLEYKKGAFYFEKALKNKFVKNELTVYSNLIDNLAYCRLKSGISDELPNLFLEGLNTRVKIGDYSLIVGSNIHLSEYYAIKNDANKSIFYSQEALKVAKKSKIPLNVVTALKQAALVDKINSSKYSEDYIRISDSLQLAERNSKDRFARIELETEEIKKENVFLEAKNRDILNYFMGTMAIAGLLFFMRAQRAKSRELILKQAQQKANEDIYKLIISQQGKLDEGRIMEKTRIAKELHDGVLGRMFGLRLNLDGLNHRTDDEAVAERIRCLEELKIIEQDLREISHELSREKYVLINNFVAIVNNLLEEQTKINTAVLSATIGEDIDWELLSNTTKINLYRILQESLQNINKYAQAKTIKVDLRKDKKGNLVLNILDDGVGFETDKNSKGIGLKNIVTRTHESEGIIDIKSSKNKGTQIKVTVPLENKSIKI